jgi:hypothetical protein
MSSARWLDLVARGEGHQSSKASLLGVRYMIGMVVVGGCRIRGRHARSLVGRHWRVNPAWGVEAVAE